MSDLTGKHVANTYQKVVLRSVDSSTGNYVGTGSTTEPRQEGISSDKYTFINGLGDKLNLLVIDSDDLNGGLYLKRNSDDNYYDGMWGIQYRGFNDTSNDSFAGLNIYKPAPSENKNGDSNAGDAKLFLGDDGSAWIGYEDNLNMIDFNLFKGSELTDLFTRNGVFIGNPSTNNTTEDFIYISRNNANFGITLSGKSSTIPNAVEGVSRPLRLIRYKISTSTSITDKILKSEDGKFFSTEEWTACIVGFHEHNTNSSIIPSFKIYHDNNILKIEVESGIGLTWYVDVLFLKRGIYDEYRNQSGTKGLSSNYENGFISLN